jgi:ribosomal protein S18 acetylase RimI-like enzyme
MRPFIVENLAKINPDELMDCHEKSFPDSHYNKFGKKFLLKSLSWYISDQNQRKMIIIKHEDRIGGFLTMKDGWDTQSFFLFMLRPLILAAICHPYRFIKYILIPQIKSIVSKDSIYQPQNGLELVSIGVLPELQGGGIGSQLASEFESIAKSKEYSAVFLSVKTGNTKAVNFYKKNGWETLENSNTQYIRFVKEI